MAAWKKCKNAVVEDFKSFPDGSVDNATNLGQADPSYSMKLAKDFKDPQTMAVIWSFSTPIRYWALNFKSYGLMKLGLYDCEKKLLKEAMVNPGHVAFSHSQASVCFITLNQNLARMEMDDFLYGSDQ